MWTMPGVCGAVTVLILTTIYIKSLPPSLLNVTRSRRPRTHMGGEDITNLVYCPQNVEVSAWSLKSRCHLFFMVLKDWYIYNKKFTFYLKSLKTFIRFIKHLIGIRIKKRTFPGKCDRDVMTGNWANSMVFSRELCNSPKRII